MLLLDSNIIEPLAFETSDAVDESAQKFISDLHHRMSSSSNDYKETAYLCQRISVIIKRFNAILLHESFDAEDPNL
jgi:hypothetical protein